MSTQSLLENFFDNSPLAMGIIEFTQNDFYYLKINAAAARLHNKSPDLIIGRTASEIGVDSKTLNEWLPWCRQASESNKPVEFQTTFSSYEKVYVLDVVLTQIARSEKSGRPLLSFHIRDLKDETLLHDGPNEEPEKDDELQFKILANSINQLSWMADANGWVYWFNNRWYEFTGTTPSEMQGWGWTKTHHPDHLPLIEKRWREGLTSGQPIEISFPLKSKSGEYRWFLTRVEPVRNASGEIIRWFGTSTDIHDQKKLEDDLKKAEERLSMAVENAHVGFYDWEISQNHMVFSDRMMKDWGIASLESCSTLESAFQLIHPDDRDRVQLAINEAIKNKTRYEIEYRVVHPDGKIVWMDVHGTIHYDQNNKPIRFFGTSVDITKRKEAEESLRKKEQELFAYIESMPQMAFMADPQGNIIYYNSQHYRYFGVNPGETENWNWTETEIHHKDDLQRTIETWQAALDKGDLYEIKYRLRRHDGEYRWHLARAYPIKDKDGQILRWVGTNTDIHDLKN